MILLGPYLVATTLLVVAGVAKAGRPGDTARALRLPPGLVRGAAGAEALLGAGALLWPHPPLAGAVALSYLGFAGFVALARRRGGALASCGCFGTVDTPPTRLHLLVDLALAGSALAVALASRGGAGGGGRSLMGLLGREPWAGVPLVASSLLAAGLVYLALGALARLGAVRGELAR